MTDHLPPAPSTSFASDNTAGLSPAVLDAIAAADGPSALAYGDDRWTDALNARFSDLLGRRAWAFPCWGGTGANIVGIAAALDHWQSVLCAESAHLVTDEGGAPSRIMGAQLLTLPTADGRLSVDQLHDKLSWIGDVHHPQTGVVSITNVTELGSVYPVEEIAAIAEVTHRAGARLHLDGARLANALAATGSTMADMIAGAGVDVFTWGATKNGAMYGDVVVTTDEAIAARIPFVRKQSAQLASKMRYLSAQVLVLLDDDRWLDQARHANAMAALLAERAADIDGVTIERAPQANSVFVQLPAGRIAPLQEWSFFWDWDLSCDLVRWMTHFGTTEDDIDRFLAGVRHILAMESPASDPVRLA